MCSSCSLFRSAWLWLACCSAFGSASGCGRCKTQMSPKRGNVHGCETRARLLGKKNRRNVSPGDDVHRLLTVDVSRRKAHCETLLRPREIGCIHVQVSFRYQVLGLWLQVLHGLPELLTINERRRTMILLALRLSRSPQLSCEEILPQRSFGSLARKIVVFCGL